MSNGGKGGGEKLKAIAMHKIGDFPVIGWAALALLALPTLAGIIIASQPEPPAPEPVQEVVEKTPEELRTEEIQKGFSSWDGSHIELTKMVKAAMNDPDSFEHVETKYYDHSKLDPSIEFITVVMTFRGTNKFGAVVTDTVSAKVDIDGSVIEIED